MAGALMAGASIPTLEPESGQRRRYTRMVRGKFTDSLPRTQRLASCACLKRPREATSPSSNRASADSRIALCRAGTGSAPTLPTRFRAAPLPAESADLFPADTIFPSRTKTPVPTTCRSRHGVDRWVVQRAQVSLDQYIDCDAPEIRLVPIEPHLSQAVSDPLDVQALLTLPDKQRLVFNMKYFDNLKYDEIAKITKTSVGALKASYHLAVKKIENLLKQH